MIRLGPDKKAIRYILIGSFWVFLAILGVPKMAHCPNTLTTFQKGISLNIINFFSYKLTTLHIAATEDIIYSDCSRRRNRARAHRAGRTWGLASLCAWCLQMALLCYYTKTSSFIYKCLLKMAHHFLFFS